jgi:hypothetical protein
MTTHNLRSPSKAHRWTACPGSIREEAKYPGDDSNPASIDGTRTHTLLSSCLMMGLPETSGFVDTEVKDEYGTFTVDKDRAARVQVALDYIAERRKLYGDCVVRTETQVDPAWLIGRKDLGGTADVIIEAPAVRVLEVIDYKDGMGGVAAEDNPQLELYAIGALAALKIPINLPYPFDLVRMTIVQPKLALKGLPAISGWEVPVSHLLGRLGHYAARAAATDAPDAPLVPGDSQCRWCRAKGACPALMSSVMESTMGMFKPTTDVALPMASIVDVAAAKEPTTLDNGKIREVLEAAPLLRQFLDAVETEALRRIKAGQAIPGLKAVYGRGTRAWSLPEAEMAEKLVKMGIPKGSVFETKLISPAKAEKVTWQKRDGTQKQLTPRQLATMEQEYIVKSPGKLTVVSESDSRPAVELNAAPMFKAVEVPVDVLPAWLQ